MKKILIALFAVWFGLAMSISGAGSSSSSGGSRSSSGYSSGGSRSSSGYSSGSRSSSSGYSSGSKSSSGYSSGSSNSSKSSSGYTSPSKSSGSNSYATPAPSKPTIAPPVPKSSSGYTSPSKSEQKSATAPISASKPEPPKKPTAFGLFQQKTKIVPPKSKEDYVKEYKASNAQKYANTFEKEPEVRPDYVPPKVQRDGQDYDVKYNPTTRSYGYTIPSTGVFMAFDPLDYMAMNSYRNYAAQPPVYVPVQGSSIGTTILTVFLVLIAVLAVVFFLGFIMQRRS